LTHRRRLVAQAPVAELLAPTGRVLVATPDPAAAAALAGRLPGLRIEEQGEDRLLVHLDGVAPEALNRQLVEGGVPVREPVAERPTLEDVFLNLTKDSPRAPG